jgi:malonyl-CoA/methylmalonyl-CoA synthetase
LLLVARREGKYYFIVGRASMDILKSGGYKISALDVEREILGLPYISEVMVVGVLDEEFGQRVAAAITLQEEELTEAFRKTYGKGTHIITIYDLRRDLSEKLAGYKMPTLLRVIQGEFPKTATGKVLKKVLGKEYFPDQYFNVPEVQIWNPTQRAKL